MTVSADVFNRRRQAAQEARRSGGGDSWSPKKAPLGVTPHERNVFRIGPPHPNMIIELEDGTRGLDPWVATVVHFALGPNQDTAAPCLEQWGLECPACVWNTVLKGRWQNQSDPQIRAEWKDMAWNQRPTNRYGCQILDMAKPNMGWQQYWQGSDIHDRLRACFYDDNRNFRDITDPHTGRDIIMEVGTKPDKRKREGWPDYSVVRAKDTPSPLIDMGLLDKLIDLTQYLWQPSADDVKGALEGRKIERPQTTVVAVDGTKPAAALTPGTASQGADGARSVGSGSTPAAAAAAAPTPETSAPAGRGRGRRAEAPTPAGASAAAPTPGTVTAPAAAPTPVPGRRAAAAPAAVDVYAEARIVATHYGFTPFDLHPDKVKSYAAPSCYLLETDPSDKQACQPCPLFLDCMTARLTSRAGAKPWTDSKPWESAG